MRLRLPLLAVLAGCATSHGTEPSLELLPVIELPGSLIPTPVFEVPGTVQAGVPFEVTYATFGSSSCTKHQAPTVSRGDGVLTIEPRLAPVPPGAGCTDDLATNVHKVLVSWPSPTNDLQVVLRGFRHDRSTVEVRRLTRVR